MTPRRRYAPAAYNTLYPLGNDPLREWIPDEILTGTAVEVRVPERVCVECAQSVTPAALVKVGSNPRRGLIILHPTHYRPGTATGEALRAHEYYHEWQRRQFLDFEARFEQEALRVQAQGLPPWSNSFEAPAYAFEAEVKRELLARGYPQ